MNSSVPANESSYEMGKRLFNEGLAQFRAGGFFEAHDLWEEFWQELRGPDRLFLQGLIHLAVGTYHFENGNQNGARSQLNKALAKLDKYPEGHWGVERAPWRDWINRFLASESESEKPEGLSFYPSRFPAALPMAPQTSASE